MKEAKFAVGDKVKGVFEFEGYHYTIHEVAFLWVRGRNKNIYRISAFGDGRWVRARDIQKRDTQ